MDFQNSIKVLGDKIQSFKANTKTEEATKTAFVIPFLRMLGYDDSNPTEVIPEFTADFGNKKFEKVDYAIFLDNNPIMIIECKHWSENLNVHNSQLFRYFNATQTRFGLLTNGIKYQFFTDLDETNKMDKEPFLEFDFENIKENIVSELLKFQKAAFDLDKILDSASELKFLSMLRAVLEVELTEPSEEFVRFLYKKLKLEKNLTSKMLEQFTLIVKRATSQTIKELVNERLKSALKKEEDIQTEIIDEKEESLIETTEEEIEGFMLVKSIIRTKSDVKKILYKDNQNYFAIYYDKQTQPICRLHFNRSQKYIGLLDENKKEERIAIESLDDIYNFSDRLIETVTRYL
ncbi:MAG: type I restriction enzyme HsdR N-terminal domain-containing protein [Bacteroidales bacterium]|jgi:hypothetical protein|nr:type I restriction enzyme HsdR N-terminal domain-containing protein [Bacteroidales bacterium]MDY0198586.1 type I restriction enzyme HsdR N-terminal domain-containing protein [Tenuifilaceae bacterium]